MIEVRSRKLAAGKTVSVGKLAASGLMSSTALFPAISAVAAAGLLLAPNAAYAQDGGNGGTGGGGGGASGVGTTDGSVGGAGSNGIAPGSGGGGGGAGRPGGAGGAGEGGAAGGFGGTASAFGSNPGDGGENATNAGGGGGGGGAAGSSYNVTTGTTIGSAIVMGGGGFGGAGLDGGSGGGGGAGGSFSRVYSRSSTLNFNPSATFGGVEGGAGGDGGAGGVTGNGGAGGAGGAALRATFPVPVGSAVNVVSGRLIQGGSGGAGGAGVVHGIGGSGGAGLIQAGGTLNNAGTIRGGQGGTGSVVGAGGLGLIGTNITLNNTGTITGGRFGDLATRAPAIRFVGTNTVNALGTTIGGIEIDSGTTTLNPGVGSFTIDNLSGSGNLVVTSGDLVVGSAGGATAFRGVISGAGGLIKTGASIQVLTGVNTYTGLTTVDAGGLTLASGGVIAGHVLNNATFTNAGTVSGLVTNNGMLTSTGSLLGGLTQSAGSSVTVSGTLNGVINNAGGLTVDGNLSSNGFVNNTSTGIVTVNAGAIWTGLTGIDNANGDPLGGVRISGTLTTDGSVINLLGATFGIFAGGTLNAALIGNGGTFTNDGTVNANALNTGSLNNNGTWNGNLIETASTTTNNNGTFNGNFTINLGGVVNNNVTGIWNNNSGTVSRISGGSFNNFGLLTGLGVDVDGATALFANNMGGTVTLDMGSRLRALNGGIVSNSGTVTGGGEASLGGVIQNLGGGTWTGALTALDGGTITNSGTVTGAGQVASGGIIQNRPGVFLMGSLVDRGIWNGSIGVDLGGSLTNGGTINGTVTNAGLFVSSSILNGSLINQTGGSVSLGGQMNGPISNDGTITLTNVTTGIRAVTQGSGGVFALSGIPTSFGSLAGAGSVLLGSGILATGSNNTSTTFAGVISGSGGLTKVGTGVFTLSGVNTYTGLTTVSRGRLAVASTGRIAGNVLNNATFNNAGSVTGMLRNNASGTANNSGTISGGVNNIGSFTSTGTITGTLINSLSGTVLLEGAMNGNIDNAGLITLTGITTGITNLNQGILTGTFDLANFNTAIGSLSGGGSVLLGSATLTIGSASGSTGFFGTISGSGGVTKVGDSIQTFSGAQTYTGLTQIDGGTLTIFDGSLAGSVVNNALFSLNGSTAAGSRLFGDLTNKGIAEIVGQVDGAVANNGRIFLLGDSTFLGAFTNGLSGSSFELSGFNASLGSLAGTGTVLLGSGTLTTGTDNTSTAFSGVISGSGALTKVGTGTFTLSGVNTYTGLTTVDAGTLVLALGGQIAGAVVNNATFDNAGLVGGTLLNNSGATATNSGTITGLVTNAGTFTSTGTLSGGLSNSGASQLSGAVNGDVTNSGTITLTGITTGIDEFVQTGTGIFNLSGFNTTLGSLAGAGQVNLGSALLTTGGNNASTTFSGVIAGSGGLTKVGTGIFVLSGANTFTGLTTVSAGALGIDTSGSLAGAVLNNASLINLGTITGLVTNNAALLSQGTLNGGLSNNAGATAQLSNIVNGGITNAGLITLVGGLTASGTFVQDASGVFNLAGFNASLGSLAGAGSVQLNSGSVLTTGGNNTSTTFAGVISGNGALIKVGTGTFTLSGLNTYTGLTRVDAGTLVLALGGEIAGSVINNATFTNAGTVLGILQNNGGATATNSGSILSGVINAGTLTSTGTINVGLENIGTVQLSGALNGFVGSTGTITLTGTTTGITSFDQTSAGTFNLAGFNTTIGALLGAGSVNLGSARLTTGSLGNSTFSGVISGMGSLEKVGASTRFILTGANTYTGGTTITGGALQLGNGGTTGSIVGPIVNNGILTVNRSDAYTLASLMSGSGIFVQDGTGTTTLTAANTYSGGTLISRGRLVGNTTSLQGTIQIDAPGTLEFAQGTAGTYAGSLLGPGRFEKTGAGLLTLTGNSSTFTGPSFVIGGELRVNGDLRRSVVTVQSGTTLSGMGTIGGLVALSGSTVAPGTSPGTLNVNGNVSLAAGSTVQFEVGATGPIDRILATGTASVNGTAAFTNLSGPNAYAFNSTYLLMQADGGRTGTFAGSTGFGQFGILYRPELVYTANQVLLRMAPNLLTNIVGTTPLTPNQRSVVTRIDTAITRGYNPQPLFDIYTLLNTQLPDAFDQISGEVYATAAGVGIEQERLIKEAVLDRIGSVAMAARADAEAAKGVGVWGQFFGGWGDGESDGNAASFEADRTGFITGIDVGGGNDTSSWRLGVYGMQVQSDVTIAPRVSRAEVEQSGGGAYASFNTGGFGVAVGGYLTSVDLTAFRDISLPGFAETDVGRTEGKARQAFAELSYAFGSGKSYLRPFLNGTVGSFKLDAMTEVGGPAALVMRKQSYEVSTVTGGVDGSVLVGKKLRLGGALAGRFQLGDRDPQAQLALAAAPASAFTISGAQFDKRALAAHLDATLELDKNLSISVGYTGLIGETVTDHGARATLQVRF